MKLPFVSRALYEHVTALLDRVIRERDIAQDRLYAAWKDGMTIPPRSSVVPAEPVEVKVLPEKLHAYVQNWESPEVRQELEMEARRLHYDLGFTEERVLALFASRNGGGEPG